jgi:hypothetical protein
MARVYAAITLTPGAVMSGFRISGLTGLGPCDEKAAMDGAGFVDRAVTGFSTYPAGDLYHHQDTTSITQAIIINV